MTFVRLLFRSLVYHWRAHLGAALAAAVGTAVLCGALIVGDSVRHSLLAITSERLGSTELALTGGDHFFRDDLPARLAQQPQFTKNAGAHAILLVPGIAIHEDDDVRAYQVQIIGANPDFWTLGTAGSGPSAPLERGEVALNASLAHKLGAKKGDSIRFRINKPGALPLDAPLGKKNDSSVILRAKVKEVLPDRGLGRFSLNANQAAPYNAFFPIGDIQAKLMQKGRANVLLLSGISDSAAASAALAAAWTLDDGQIRVREEPKLRFTELSSPRVFLDDSFAEGELAKGAQGISTYFINSIRAPGNGNETPYSMMAAAGAPLTDSDLKDDEIEINQWTADDLQVKPGDRIEITYFALGLLRKLETRTAQFTLKKVVPIEAVHADRALMPDFPGIANVDSTHDWDPSIPIDKAKIRPKDEDYWKEYRGTPKAFITLNKGRELWSNRFGVYTALRFPSGTGGENHAAIQEIPPPQSFGLSLMPVKALGQSSAAEGTDFAGLFLGFSFFLIVAALLLMALVFQFGVESRSGETGLLLAVGFTARRVRMALLLEGVLVAAIGSAAGVFGATAYAQALLTALATQWNAAVGTSALEYFAEPSSLAIGYASGIFMAAIAIFFAVRRQASRSARELLASQGNLQLATSRKTGGIAPAIGLVCFVAAGGLVGWALATGNRSSAEVFFSAGALLLIAALIFVRRIFGRLKDPSNPSFSRGGEQRQGASRTLMNLGVRNCSRRAGRSTATAALLACGTFLVVAVGANKQDAAVNARERSSGTGGFALYAQSTGPVFEDLNTPKGRHNAGVPDAVFDGVTLYPLRVKNGDEASCLNLNRAGNPRVVGVPEALMQRGGFTFASTLEPAPKDHPWEILNGKFEAIPAIPAICDDQVLTYILGLKLGDELSIADEHGVARKIKFVATLQNSILQGSVLISEDAFLKLYPSLSGYSAFLIDAPFEKSADTAKGLAHALADEGFDPIPAAERLASFNAVENTYLSTFQALGGLGMLLGSLGLGVVVLRNMLERRSELALLRAVGYSRAAIGWLVMSEHAWLLVLGLGAGLIAALVAVMPALQSTSVPVPWLSLGATLAGVFGFGFAAALLATWWMLRQPLLPALRSE
jgi:putative ABC transport system permease protein